MQIVCPNCATSYEIDASSLGESGRTVRCAHCKDTWFAQLPQLEAAGTASPSMWQEEEQESGWTAREGQMPDQAGFVPEDRFATQQSEVEFALPQDMPEVAEAPRIAPEPDTHAHDMAPPETAPTDAVAPEDAGEPDYYEVRRRRQVRRVAKPKKPFFTKGRLITACAGVLIALVLGREHVARLMPQVASLYAHLGMPINLRGLAFEDIRSVIEKQDGVSVLVIEGAIRNVTRDSLDVPRLRFAMRNAAGAEIYSWTAMPERTVLPAGQTQSFRTRLASPPGESHQVYVRFFQKSDIVATNQR